MWDWVWHAKNIYVEYLAMPIREQDLSHNSTSTLVNVVNAVQDTIATATRENDNHNDFKNECTRTDQANDSQSMRMQATSSQYTVHYSHVDLRTCRNYLT